MFTDLENLIDELKKTSKEPLDIRIFGMVDSSILKEDGISPPKISFLTTNEESLLTNIKSQIRSLHPQLSDKEDQKKKLNTIDHELTEWTTKLKNDRHKLLDQMVLKAAKKLSPIIEKNLGKIKETKESFDSEISDLKKWLEEINTYFEKDYQLKIKTNNKHILSTAEITMETKIQRLKQELNDFNNNMKESIHSYEDTLEIFKQSILEKAHPFGKSKIWLGFFNKMIWKGYIFEKNIKNLKININSLSDQTKKLSEKLNSLKEKLELSRATREASKIKHHVSKTILKFKTRFQTLEEELKAIKENTSHRHHEILQGAGTATQSKVENEIEIFQKKLDDFFEKLANNIDYIKNNYLSFQKKIDLPFMQNSKIWNKLQKETQAELNKLDGYQNATGSSIRHFKEQIKDLEKQLNTTEKAQSLVIEGRELDKNIKKDLYLFQKQINELEEAPNKLGKEWRLEPESSVSGNINLKQTLAQLDKLGEEIKKSTKNHLKDYNEFHRKLLKKEKEDNNVYSLIQKGLPNLDSSLYDFTKNGNLIQRQIKKLKEQNKQIYISHIQLILRKRADEHHDEIVSALNDFKQKEQPIVYTKTHQHSLSEITTKDLLNLSDKNLVIIEKEIRKPLQKLIAVLNIAREETDKLLTRFKSLQSKTTDELKDELQDLTDKSNELILNTKSSIKNLRLDREKYLIKKIDQLEKDSLKNNLAIKHIRESNLPRLFTYPGTSVNPTDEMLVAMDKNNFEIFTSQLKKKKNEVALIKEKLEETLLYIEDLNKTHNLLNSKEHENKRKKINDWKIELYPKYEKILQWWSKQKPVIFSKLELKYWNNKKVEALKLKKEIDALSLKDDPSKKYEKEINKLKTSVEKIDLDQKESIKTWEKDKTDILLLGENHLNSINESINTIKSFQKNHTGWPKTTEKYLKDFQLQKEKIRFKIDSVKLLKLKHLKSLLYYKKKKLSKKTKKKRSIKPQSHYWTRAGLLTGALILGPILGILTGLSIIDLGPAIVIPTVITITFTGILAGALSGIIIGNLVDKKIEKKRQEKIASKKKRRASKLKPKTKHIKGSGPKKPVQPNSKTPSPKHQKKGSDPNNRVGPPL